MEKKKRSVFQLFIIPLVFVVVAQAVLAYGIIYSSGTMESIAEYSVDTLRQTVRNRKIILENHMIQQWSNLDEEIAILESRLSNTLIDRHLTIEEFMNHPEYHKEFVRKAAPTTLYMLRKNGVSGSFLVLANPQAGDMDTALEGIYFRDSDPTVNPGDYSDVLMERGDTSFSQEFKIPLDTLWKSKFEFQRAGAREADEFFLSPYLAARERPEIGYENLAFWSKPYCMEGNADEDSYQMISYSVPLIYKGTVYGVLGIEISEKYFAQNLPSDELDYSGEKGYLLMMKTADEKVIPLFVEGTSKPHQLASYSELDFRETKYNGLYEVSGLNADGEKPVYACVEEFRLYNSNTPFADQIWMIAGIRDREGMFGVRDDIMRHLVLSLFLSLLFGLAGTYLTVRLVSGPIKRLSECIRQSPENELGELAETGIQEVDGLYHVVRDLTEQQKAAENSLIEEKERYRMALESSADTMFTYDIRTGRVDVLNFNGSAAGFKKEFYPKASGAARDNGVEIAAEDEPAARNVFTNIQDKASVQFRARHDGETEYRWVEMSCKAIYDTDQNRTKIIGRVKDIHEQKIKELERQNADLRDAITGLYSKDAGLERIYEQMEACGEGALVLMDIDHFRELNEKFGMVFGDSMIEEIGRILLAIKKQFVENGLMVTALRAGGDEVMAWIGGGGAAEARNMIQQLRDGISAAYQNSDIRLQLSYGASAGEYGRGDFGTLFDEACCALNLSKMQGSGNTVIYQEMTEEQRKSSSGRTPINEIASLAATEHLNMVSQVFNFFDKSGDIHSIIPVLLVKLGRCYRASDILIVQTDAEFFTSYISYQWHGDPEHTCASDVRRYDSQAYYRLTGDIGKHDFRIRETSGLGEDERHMLFIPDGQDGIVISMFDKGVFIGAMIYLAGEGAECWKEAEKNDLIEITKLIETNIINQRYDLASKAKSDFLSRMSHEIRTPMNAIIGMTGIALEKMDDPAQLVHCLEKIDQSSKFLLSLINDILDMSKIESGKMQLEIGYFNLVEMLEGVRDIIQPQMDANGLNFVVEAPEQAIWLKGDRLRLNQVLVNLLSNALKFTPKGGKVCLRVHTETDGRFIRAAFSVRDTGIGIKAEDMERIFNSFEQADDQSVLQYGGTGLGLTISSRFIRMMGGEIKVRSEVGRGSEFYFEVRLKRGRAEAPRQEKDMQREISFAGKRILVVEDNELNAEIAAVLLRDHGAEVETAENGKEAVNLFCGHEPGYYSLVLMDVRMPVMDGLEATRQIRGAEREDSASIPIIAMSANAFDGDMKKSVESGMNGHLAKPIDVSEFLDTIDRMIR